MDFQRNEDEIPGWLVPQIYQDYVQNGISEPLKGVFYHNEIDVVSLAALFLKISQMLAKDDLQGNETFSIGEIYQRFRKYEEADRYYKNALEDNPDEKFRERILQSFAFSLKKQGKLDEMSAVWEELAKIGNITACIELAKYFEHQKKDLSIALLWTEKAINFIQPGVDTPFDIQNELSRRLKRLQIKLEKK